MIPPITDLYAFLTTLDGDEGIAAVWMAGSGWIPCVFASREQIEKFRPLVELVCKREGATWKLARFSAREDLDEGDADVQRL